METEVTLGAAALATARGKVNVAEVAVRVARRPRIGGLGPGLGGRSADGGAAERQPARQGRPDRVRARPVTACGRGQRGADRLTDRVAPGVGSGGGERRGAVRRHLDGEVQGRRVAVAVRGGERIGGARMRPARRAPEGAGLLGVRSSAYAQEPEPVRKRRRGAQGVVHPPVAAFRGRQRLADRGAAVEAERSRRLRAERGHAAFAAIDLVAGVVGDGVGTQLGVRIDLLRDGRARSRRRVCRARRQRRHQRHQPRCGRHPAEGGTGAYPTATRSFDMNLVGEVALDGAAGEGVVLDGDAVAVEIVSPYLIGEDDGAVRVVVSRRRVAAGGAFDDRPHTVATAADASSRNPGVVPGKPIVLSQTPISIRNVGLPRTVMSLSKVTRTRIH